MNNYPLCFFFRVVTNFHLFHHLVGQIGKRHACDAVGIAEYGLTLVATLTDALHYRYLPEQVHLHLIGQTLAAIPPKGNTLWSATRPE